MAQVLGVGWYRFRATFRRRWSGYLGVVLLVGLIGGITMASIAGARRTQSSYPSFLRSVNPSDLGISIFNGTGAPPPVLTAQIAHLAGVKRARAVDGPQVAPLEPDGAPDLNGLGDFVTVGSADGEFSDQDRVALLRGAIADQARADQVMMTPTAAQFYDVHVGQVLPLGVYSPLQESLPGFGTPKVAPRLRVDATVVGIVELSNEVVQDDIDRAYGFVFVTAALLREVSTVAPLRPAAYEMVLDHGARSVPAVEQEIIDLIPRGFTYEFHVTAPVVTEVQLAVKPESVALGGFGAIAALVCLVLAGQAISRQLSSEEDERRVLWSFGASRAVTAADALLGILAALVLGSVLAFVVAVGLSPLAPIGPVRAVYPDKGIAFDWTVLGAGLAILIVGLGLLALVLVIRGAPGQAGADRPARARSSGVVRTAEAAGMSVAGVEGLRLALEPSRGQGGVPARSALLGTALAVSLVVATLTFSSGLTTLVTHPALYGWDWSYTLNASNTVPPRALTLLNHDPDVAAWTGVDYFEVELDDETVPVLQANPNLRVSPPVLSGHGLQANNQIVVGAATLSLLHKRVGDTVSLSFGTRADAPLYIPPTPLKIIGTATFPAVGFSSTVADHTSMGTGALIALGTEPAAMQRATLSPDPNLNGPNLVFVRLRPGVSAAAGRAGLQRIAEATDRMFAADPNAATQNVTVIGVQRPAQIVNYRSIGSTPIVLAIGVAIGAIVALALTLTTSVRRRRRDLGLLKALGFTRRQLAAAVAWQATFAAVIGVVVGIPVGIASGRELWTLFAQSINAVPDPTVPVLAVMLVGIGALLFANLVAAFPGRSAARTQTAVVLRTE